MELFGRASTPLGYLAFVIALGSLALAACNASDSSPSELALQGGATAEPYPSPTPVYFSGNIGFDIGDQVPDFEINLTNGTPITSDELQGEERPTFLFFFSMT